MSNLFVIAYDDVATANQVRDKVVTLSRQHLIDLEDVVVVERREADGKIKLHQAVNLTAAGATGGALWGGVIGLLFLAPLLGAAVGAAAGAAGGAARDVGVNDDFMREVSSNLRPGAAALFALAKSEAVDKVVAELAPFGGQLVQTSLSSEDEEHLKAMVQAARAGEKEQPTTRPEASGARPGGTEQQPTTRPDS
ncbi:DUF1269 domain-containing protein [Streptomyces sp. NPDC090052]|uniref:DUF1269 domain-containing protein n=1 Tax=unclassified Streptomyces TaxID=2593676 RepID=UPI0022535A2B|nr:MULTISPECIES: DUF1269 domain-containing protein [unclassified Streptomyces]MCX4726293.1 DUF1269 domain-containing protein [Streptomyces sp. NBC_01306]WSV04371.1 DUF1269 domain-containing protein [Streptomyces sp. NBC_01020]WSX42442.1 DUF1269 domain-containing protein [Streptomyces sp. NBC_00963]WSX69514.1 DUF1269 domain-containing protein [Streptomyces sp. NBC_00932]